LLKSSHKTHPYPAHSYMLNCQLNMWTNILTKGMNAVKCTACRKINKIPGMTNE